MRRPTRYYVEQFDPDEDSAIRYDCASLSEARRAFGKMGGRVMERYNIRDDSDSEPVHGVMWDWDEREILS